MTPPPDRSYPVPPDEEQRLATLHSYAILDTEPTDAFNDIVRLASYICGTPISLVTLVDESRQWFLANKGLASSETPREEAFCAHAIVHEEVMEVPNALEDERFVQNPLVTGDPNIRFYAGAPLITQEGHALGTLCVIDREPRTLSEEQKEMLRVLSRQVVAQLELRRSVKGLATLRREFELILNSAAEGIYGLDRNGRCVFVNPAAAHLSGFEVHELLRQRHHDLIHHTKPDGSPYPWRECPNHATLTDGRPQQVRGEVFWRKDGTSYPVEYTTTPIFGEGAKVTGAVVVFRDVTERLEIEKMKSDLVSVVSHELRTPLTSIMGYLDALLDGEAGELNEEQLEYTQIVFRNAQRLHALITDLLTLSRLESGKMQIKLEAVDLRPLIDRIVAEQVPLAREKQVQLNVRAPSSVRLVGDATRLTQALANLVGNAVKFSPSGGVVDLDAAVEDDHVVVEVRDRGPGIPEAEVARLFQRFFRASTARSVEGTGLGLAIAKELVELHEGRIWVDSEVGRGTSFFVALPLKPAARD